MKVATTQMKCSWDKEENVANAERLVRDAAQQGAKIILIQEPLSQASQARSFRWIVEVD